MLDVTLNGVIYYNSFWCYENIYEDQWIANGTSSAADGLWYNGP